MYTSNMLSCIYFAPQLYLKGQYENKLFIHSFVHSFIQTIPYIHSFITFEDTGHWGGGGVDIVPPLQIVVNKFRVLPYL